MADITSPPGLVALGALALALIALGVAVRATRALRELRAAQQAVLGEHGEQDLVAHAARLDREFGALNDYVADIGARLDGRLGLAEGRLDGALVHRGLVRYDAYNEMSGRQSTTIALLDAHRSGIILSSIAHRDQARLYAKQVTEGVADLQLSPEEEQALAQAVASPLAPSTDAL